jgi:pimeloyl-ACP methyl ester carboxylesterase
VIRFDNRDTGRSTHVTGAPDPDLAAALTGDLSGASYTLSDMAADTAGLLDALGLGGSCYSLTSRPGILFSSQGS